MADAGPMSEAETVQPDEVTHALRRVRASVYRVERDADGARIALVLDVSAAGRRNAAATIVAALAEHNLEVVADDPVDALAVQRTGLPIRPRR